MRTKCVGKNTFTLHEWRYKRMLLE